MNMRLCLLLAALLIYMYMPAQSLVDYTAYVNPYVGTAASVTKGAGLFGKGSEEFGQTLPAVFAPNGMNFWTPQTRDTEHKCVAPYYYADSLLQGFRNSHWIVGGCTQDYGSVTFMPLYGNLRTQPEKRASRFSHSDEVCTPYYYSTRLPDEGITAKMTATSRTALFSLHYDKSGKAYLVFNPNSDEGEGSVRIDTMRRRILITNPVHRIYQGKGQRAGYSGYYVAEIYCPITDFGVFDGASVFPHCNEISGKPQIGCYVEIDAADEILVKAASSFTSLDGAVLNLNSEMPDWDFEAVSNNLKNTWNRHLGRIEAESDNIDQLRKFYTAYYHASFLPHEINDADGFYPAFSSGEITRLPEGETAYYDDYSLWDTYRALHPLLNLISPTQSGEMMQSLVHKYEQGGWMPIFPCWNSYTAAMIGDHAASAIADAYIKGIRNFDADKAYQGLRQNAFDLPTTEEYVNGKGRRALASYIKYGYIPLEDSVQEAYHKKEQVSRTLEYAYDDFCLMQLAKALGKNNDCLLLNDRAMNYANVINPTSGYADGRYADGTFANDNPYTFTKHITEGAPCHYTWYVPHDPEGLITLMGGKKAFEEKLDSMFSERRYWHGNEPCHQIAFLYDCINEQEKAAKEVCHILDTEYLDCPGGLSGNDDAGQMSAWYMFSAMGFYPVCPGTPYYAISCPTFKSLTIHLENGNDIKFLVPNASKDNLKINSIKHNGQEIKSLFLDHFDLMKGGLWEFKTL